jgi:salicylate hydroxylase
MTSVVVVGAGLGGLSTALSLHHWGIEPPVILEQTEKLDPVGAGIQLGPNANRVLERLGVLDEVCAVAFQPETLDFLDGRHGTILQSIPLRSWVAQKFRQPFLNVHRGDLQTILAKAVEERLPGSIRVGSRVDDVGQHENTTFATLVDGRTINGDVLIGADGVHSRVRQAVVAGQVPARFTGHVAYRMLVPRADIDAASMPRPSVSIWLGAHGLVVSYWVRGGELYNIVTVTENSEWRAESWRIPGDVDALRSSFRGWAPQLHALFGAATDIHQWALLDHPVPRWWVRDRIALLGDSCHAMLPYLAQGAAMALEDAWSVGQALAEDPDPALALRRYSVSRVERATRVHAQSTKNGEVYQRSSPAGRILRDLALSAMGRLFRDRFLRRLEWIYSFDPTNQVLAGR